ncbi:MAG TPA: ankyrin repeat domain-containing protein, partial [Waddliaceae bacterium]
EKPPPETNSLSPTPNLSSLPIEPQTPSTQNLSAEKAKPSALVLETLFNAVENGNLKTVVETFQKYDIDVNTTNSMDNTLLHKAAKAGKLKIVQFLLEKNASLQLKNMQGNSPLHLAASNGNVQIVKLLLEKNASLELTNLDGNTPLHLAASGGRTNVLEILISEKNASLESENKRGDTPLHLAAKEGNAESVKFLLEKKAPTDLKNNNGLTPFHAAIQANTYTLHAVIRAFIDSLPNLIDTQDMNGRTALHKVALNDVRDREHIVAYLLEKNASVSIEDNEGDTPLHCAIIGKGLFGSEIPLLLLDKGADIEAKNTKGETPLHIAVRLGKEVIFNSLITKNASPECKDNQGNTLLSSAARNGNLNIAKTLLKKHPDFINQPNNAGFTPLRLAAGAHKIDDDRSNESEDRSKMMTLLIENGANVDQEIDGKLLVHWAYQKRNCSKVFDAIVERTEKINELDSVGKTVLGKAAQDGQILIAKKLLSKNAHVELGTKTPLQLAAEKHSSANDRSKILLYLINEAQANVNKTVHEEPFIHWAYINDKGILNASLPKVSNINEINKNGYTLLGRAVETGDQETTTLLLQHKADVSAGLQTDRIRKPPLQLAADKFSSDKNKNRPTKIDNNIVNILIENGAEVDNTQAVIKGKNEPFIHWVYNYPGCAGTLELVLNRTKNIDMLDTHGYSVLARAANQGDDKTVDLFIKHEADPNIRVKGTTMTPLQLAANKFSSDKNKGYPTKDDNTVVNLLIENGAEVD